MNNNNNKAILKNASAILARVQKSVKSREISRLKGTFRCYQKMQKRKSFVELVLLKYSWFTILTMTVSMTGWHLTKKYLILFYFKGCLFTIKQDLCISEPRWKVSLFKKIIEVIFWSSLSHWVSILKSLFIIFYYLMSWKIVIQKIFFKSCQEKSFFSKFVSEKAQKISQIDYIEN